MLFSRLTDKNILKFTAMLLTNFGVFLSYCLFLSSKQKNTSGEQWILHSTNTPASFANHSPAPPLALISGLIASVPFTESLWDRPTGFTQPCCFEKLLHM